MQVFYEVVKAERAAMRQGTHKVKNRSEVAGGGRKPWRPERNGGAPATEVVDLRNGAEGRGFRPDTEKLPSEGQQEGSEGSVEKPFV